MSKSIKLKNNNYLDASSITYNREQLSSFLNEFLHGDNRSLYHPVDLSNMTGGNYSKIINVDRSNMFYTDWQDYQSYDTRFCGVLGIYIKGHGSSSTGGIAIIFAYGGAIGLNVRIDNNRWGGWKWL